MINSGHIEIVDLGYENPDRPRLGLEVMTFAQLRSRTRARVASSPIRADFHQLTVIRSGRGTAMIDFVPQDCRPGTVLHIRPGQVQRLPARPDGRLAGLDAIVLLFTADFAPHMSRVTSLLDLEFGPTALAAPVSEREGLHQAAAELEAEYRLLGTRDETATRLSAELLRQLLGVLLLRIARLPCPSGAGPAGVNQVFRAFRREVERSFAATRDVQDYAARLGYAPRTLTRACLAATGRTAKQFLDARVALEAKRLLVHTDLAIAAVGRAVGFSEPTNFGKFFARETNMTPGTFRAKERS
ncbi:AraC family transcriptional regulator [Streptomyces sp. UNOC14_S4]|uniref:helix-turn-helix transcriptional regulator n=1 Tax=Streptomyces sp. UNOC14_S4 TaxID=2872340 RepID=UPI001E336951|nr:AraC family transcriptional regulator [Streptomyces sp. UNOC14_S4]MCC3770613.1 AraC family transcriptional regulator [Streptomyces sp. UNOC14_S4]